MWLQRFTGIMARRLLINWRIPPHIAQRAVPAGVRPALVNGYAVAGLCLVRLEQLRPAGLPAACGFASENVAIRMGIEWKTPTGFNKGVMIFRRETGSLVNHLLAERVGFGVHAPSHLHVKETSSRTRIRAFSRNDHHRLAADVQDTSHLPPASVFPSMRDAEYFFRGSECGYSPSRTPRLWAGARLHLHRWSLQPMTIRHARSTFLEGLFGQHAELDSAFIMRDIEHTWTTCESEPFGELPPAARAAQTRVAPGHRSLAA